MSNVAVNLLNTIQGFQGKYSTEYHYNNKTSLEYDLCSCDNLFKRKKKIKESKGTLV